MDQHLDFEQPIYTCLEKIEELKKIIPAPANLAEEIALLERQSCLLYTSDAADE